MTTRTLSFTGRALLGLVCFCFAASAAADAPFINPAEDAHYFGPPEKMLFWTPEQKVSGFRNMEKLYPTRKISASDSPLELEEAPQELGDVLIRTEQAEMTLDEYFKRQNVAGLLVLKDGQIAYERYGLGNSEESRWVSFSVTKSVVSMLVGAAIHDGYIASVDEKVSDYLPRLKGSSYDQASIRDILQMASGVQWNEDYADPASDINSASWQTLALYRYLAEKDRVAAPGAVFNYNTAETNLVGTLLRSAIGNNLSTYLETKIWQPFGMSANAYWMLTEPGGGEFGGCCINATLRDYARLGLFALNDGRLPDGTAVVPDGWMSESTTPSAAYPGYGYLWWLTGGSSYRASGIFGQGICVHPEENVVVALQSARDAASEDGDWALQGALCQSIATALDN
jgi:CubicO group peptidase (beta-lactamase class C family)